MFYTCFLSDVKQKFCHSYHMQYRGASTKVDDDINDLSSDFLPDLNNEKTSEQLLFNSKDYHANKQFVRIRTDIIKWILSPPENRIYPQHVKNNKWLFGRLYCNIPMIKKGKICSRGVFVMTGSVSNYNKSRKNVG